MALSHWIVYPLSASQRKQIPLMPKSNLPSICTAEISCSSQVDLGGGAVALERIECALSGQALAQALLPLGALHAKDLFSAALQCTVVQR